MAQLNKFLPAAIAEIAMCFLVAFSDPASAASDSDEFSKIDTPSPRDTEGHFDTKIGEISEWMSAIVELTKTKRYCYRVISEQAITFKLPDIENALQITSLNFIRAEDPATQIERVIVVSQPLMTNNAIRTQNGVALDRTVEFDLYRSRQEASMVRPVSSTGVVFGKIYPNVGDDRFDQQLRLSRLFSPLMACVVPVAQTIKGFEGSIERHSILPKTVKGVRTVGPYTHTLVIVGSTSMMITFKDKRPVQLEHWSHLDKKTGEPVVTDRVRVRWQKCESGELVPVNIQGMRAARIWPGEFSCKVYWTFGKDVGEDYFDQATQGFIGFHELVDIED